MVLVAWVSFIYFLYYIFVKAPVILTKQAFTGELFREDTIQESHKKLEKWALEYVKHKNNDYEDFPL